MKLTGRVSNELREWLETADEVDVDDLRTILNAWDTVCKKGGVPPFRVVADQPVWLGEVPLYQPTLASLARRQDIGETDTLVEVWLLTNARDPEELSKEPTTEALCKLAARIGCTEEEAMAAVGAAYSGFPAQVIDVRSSEDVDDINVLSLAYSISERIGYNVDTLIWNTSMQRIMWLQQIKEGSLHASATGVYHKLLRELRSKQGAVDESTTV